MNILFLTLVEFESIQVRNIYTDLLREFVKSGHHVYVISPVEKRQNQATHLMEEENATILRLKIGNTQKTNIIEKGISTIMIEPIFKKAVKQYFSNVKFDLVLYSTPPITLVFSDRICEEEGWSKDVSSSQGHFPSERCGYRHYEQDWFEGASIQAFQKARKRTCTLFRIVSVA
jgi:hypothetical protein